MPDLGKTETAYIFFLVVRMYDILYNDRLVCILQGKHNFVSRNEELETFDLFGIIFLLEVLFLHLVSHKHFPHLQHTAVAVKSQMLKIISRQSDYLNLMTIPSLFNPILN